MAGVMGGKEGARLQYLWDLIQQTNTLCEVMRTPCGVDEGGHG